MIKKISLFLSFVLLFCIFTVSCRNGNNNGEEPNKTANNGETGTDFDLTPDSKEIVVWIHTNDPESPEVNEFVRMYPDYTVDNSVASTEPFFHQNNTEEFQRLGAAIVAGTQPDLFLGYMAPIEAYYSNMFMPAQDYLEHDPEYNFETIEKSVLDAGTFNNLVYFVPTVLDTTMMIWNRDLFEERGLDPDTLPETWSEFLEYCKKLFTYTSDGKIQSIGCNSLDWITLHVIATGRHYTDETGLKFEINTPEYNRALEFVRDVWRIYGGNKNLPSGIGFFQGNVGMEQMVVNGMQLLPIWVAQRFEFSIGKVPKPDDVEEDYYPMQCSNILAIPRAARNPKGGWMYLKYNNTDGAYARAVQFFEALPDLSVTFYITHIPTRERFYKEYKDLFSKKTWEMTEIRDELIRNANVPMPYLAEHTKMKLYFKEYLHAVLNDEISPKEFLENAQSYGDVILREFKERKIEEGWKFNDDGTAVPPPPAE